MSNSGSPKNVSAPCCFELDHVAKQHADSCARHSTIRLQLVRPVAREILENSTKIREIEQQESLVVAELEHQRQHARLRFVQSKDFRKQERTE